MRGDPRGVGGGGEAEAGQAHGLRGAARRRRRGSGGTSVAVAYQSEIKLLGQTLYYLLTTGSGQQTLGEEYCDILQVASSNGLPPTPARRVLFVVYQTAVPYLAERISSRMASRGMALNDTQFEESGESNHPTRDTIQSSDIDENSSSRGIIVSPLSRFKENFRALWLSAIQRWPSVLPLAREVLQLALRTNLMFFYFEGLYYHISKRAAGIRYVFIGKPLHQRPRYQILGIFLLIQLCILGAEGLRRSNLSSMTRSIRQTSTSNHYSSTGRGLPVLNEDGNLITDYNATKGSWTSDSAVVSEAPSGMSKCTLCLSTRQHPTATSCGHVFCWNCIMEWCNEKPECPLCRTPITHSTLICIYHADF
uniref:RING-type E3 ubiquitin transferase n=1 Tax=Ananas comosus var. bracteatus TaxID=296719 RepID=A0A6V7PN29_ANACO|nr:unnamed protein product [Ananas comosus var. bracteatus]